MKYYSEKLDKLFDDEKALHTAETAHENIDAKKHAALKELNKLMMEVKEAHKKYDAAFDAFVELVGEDEITPAFIEFLFHEILDNEGK